jgi:hypothetical protein
MREPAHGAARMSGDDINVFGFAGASEGRELRVVDAVLHPAATQAPSKGNAPAKVTSMAQLHSLGVEDASRALPVHAHAVVTYINPGSGTLFVQDRTGASYVFAPRIRDLKVAAGDLVDVSGRTTAGGFAPSVLDGWLNRISPGTMPAPAPVSFDDLFAGKQDSLWVQTEGIVQSVIACCEPEVHIWLQWGLHRYLALVANPRSEPLPLPDTRVRVRGVCATLTNSRRQLVGIQLYVPSPRFFETIEAAPKDLQPRPIGDMLRFSVSDPTSHRIRVRGIVTLANGAGPSYIADSSAGLKIRNHALIGMKPGDRVDAIGFAQPGSFTPELRDAEISRLGSGPLPRAVRITAEEAMAGSYDSELVQIDALLVDEISKGSVNSLVLKSGNRIFHAALNHGYPGAIQHGSVVRVTGICSIESAANLSVLIPKDFSLTLRDAADIQVLQPAAWWTAGRLLTFLASMALLLVAVLARGRRLAASRHGPDRAHPEATRRGSGAARERAAGQPGEERVSGEHESRDSHADERRDRDADAGIGHESDARPARVHRRRAIVGAVSAGAAERNPGPIENRGVAARHRIGAVQTRPSDRDGGGRDEGMRATERAGTHGCDCGRRPTNGVRR